MEPLSEAMMLLFSGCSSEREAQRICAKNAHNRVCAAAGAL
jgi:hypothetical protein